MNALTLATMLSVMAHMEEQTMGEELKPCPFCEGKAYAESYVINAAVRCEDCGATITRTHAQYEDTGYPEAVEAWNKRALDKPSFEAGWEKAKLLLNPEDLRTAAPTPSQPT